MSGLMMQYLADYLTVHDKFWTSIAVDEDGTYHVG